MGRERWVDTAALLAQARVAERAGALRDAEAAYDALIISATRQQDQATLAEAFRRRAVLAHHAGDTARARSALEQSYAVATLLGNRLLAAESLNSLGGLELETRNLDAAEIALGEAITLASDEPALLARVSQNMGIVASIRGDHPAAQQHYSRSLAAYEALADAHGSAIARHNLGLLAADRSANLEALEHFDACEVLARISDDRHLRGLALLSRAESLHALGRVVESRQAAEAADQIFRALESRFDAPGVQRVLALCDRAEGRLQDAETRLARAGRLARLSDARLVEAEVARDLGRLYAGSGRLDEAQTALAEAARAFADLGAAGSLAATQREAAALIDDVAEKHRREPAVA